MIFDKNMTDIINSPVISITVLPDGNGGFTPCPEVLTEEEAIRFLRLDMNGLKNPANTLRYYRQEGKLKGTRISNRIYYTLKSLREFTEEVTDDPNLP